MQSILNIVCPHCQAKGRVAVPPVGAMVIGPCPKCKELVMVFSGKALPLKKDVILNGSASDKRRHIMEVLTTFLDQQIGRLVQELEDHNSSGEEHSGLAEESGNGFDMDPEEAYEEDDEMPREGFGSEPGRPSSPGDSNTISQSEVDQFVGKVLPMVDNKDYFRTIFNGG